MSGINNVSPQAALRNLGAASSQAEKPQTQPAGGSDFASQLRDVNAAAQPLVQTADAGLNAMINTSLETEAAKLQALQVQQQLGTQSQAIVNQRASTILSLFNK
jgi:hypothetical protein